MADFKPFCLADNMARYANFSEFLNRECGKARVVAAAHKKPGRASATGLFLRAG